jgi:uncharacterized phage infection (PIP) family protein YhgE
MEDRMTTLPDKARRKLATLQQERDTAQEIVRSTVNRVGDTIRALQINPEGPQAADIEFELTRLRATQGKAQQKFEALSSLLANLRMWLSQVKPHVQLVDAKSVKIKERSGESIFDAIDRTRSEISKMASELRDVRDAGLPLDEVKAQAAKWVEQQARRASPKITATQKEFNIEFGVQSSFTNPAPDFGAFMALLAGDDLLDLLCKEIEKLPVPKLVLTPAERDKRMGETKESLLRLERTEEQLIILAEQDDHVVPRRPAADPAAVLGVVVERAAKAVA